MASAKTVSKPCARIALSGKDMNGSGSVLGQVLSNIQLSLDYIGIIRWNEAFKSYCDLLGWILHPQHFPLFPFPTFLSLASVILTSRCLLGFLVFQPFPVRYVYFLNLVYVWLFQTFYMGTRKQSFLSLIRGQKKRKQYNISKTFEGRNVTVIM